MPVKLDNALLDALLTKFPGQYVGPSRAAADANLHLFHAPNSICSQKVRSTLIFHDIPFHAHEIKIFKSENYFPAYVKTRMVGCAEAGIDLSHVHQGSTSARHTGCDACVVPTLVDASQMQVSVDSFAICKKLDAYRPSNMPSLLPNDLADAIFTELELVDALPNYPLLGAAIARKNNYQGQGNPFAASKVARCNQLLETHADDPQLVAAYSAKRDKESSADQNLFTPQSLAKSRNQMEQAIAGLDARLAEVDGAGLFGDRVTMADLFWAVELVRSQDLLMSYIWEDGELERVQTYYTWLQSIPALQQGVLDWPGARMEF